jgi:hypothetical protein
MLHQESKLLGERKAVRTSEDQAISPKPLSKLRFLSRLFPPPSARPPAQDRTRAEKNRSSSRTRAATLQRLVSSRRICDRKWILSEADTTGLKQGRAMSRTVGLEHECPLTADPNSPIPAAHFLDTDRTKSIHRSPRYKSMRRVQLPVYRPQDPFRR